MAQLNTAPTTPTLWQKVGYWYGRRLPNSMQTWVRDDLIGPGSARRMVLRWTLPCVLVLAPLLLIPTTPLVHMTMTLPILIPFVYFAIALNRVYRRHRLAQHGLDPELLDRSLRERDVAQHESYARRYGPRT